MRNEDQSGSQPQQEQSDIGGTSIHEEIPRRAGWPAARVIASIIVFGCAYFVTLLLISRLAIGPAFPFTSWIAVSAAAVATAVAILVCENGRWSLGLLVPVRAALTDAGVGIVIAVIIIGATDAVVELMAGVRHALGGGFPWLEVFVIFIPAAFHEELLFRGYPYQRMRAFGTPAAIALSSLLFAAAHAGNAAVTPLALMNVGLAGVVFCLVYELRRSLWAPFALHLTWNLTSGPILGYAVSGFPDRRSILVAYASGPQWLSGGGFGIEGSVWIGVVQAVVIAGLIRTLIRRNSVSNFAVSQSQVASRAEAGTGQELS